MNNCVQCGKIEVGIDEVARGCLFGRVYSAAVILRESTDLNKLLDIIKIKGTSLTMTGINYVTKRNGEQVPILLDEIQNRKKERKIKVANNNPTQKDFSSVPKNTLKLIEEAENN